MMWISAPPASSMNRRAASSSSIRSTRSSSVRQSRETSETATIAAMKKPAIFTPSGRSMTLTTVV